MRTVILNQNGYETSAVSYTHLGVEAVDVVMVFQNDKAMQRLLESNFQVGGDASAAAGPVGRHAEAGTDSVSYTHLVGLASRRHRNLLLPNNDVSVFILVAVLGQSKSERPHLAVRFFGWLQFTQGMD